MQMYAASLSDYNAGRLHGAWIDLEGKTADEIQEEINDMLAESRELVAEEWAAHDWEDMPADHFGEYPNLEDVAEFVAVVEANDYLEDAAEVVGVFVELGHSATDFEDYFHGVWDSERDYAQQYAKDIGAVPESYTWPTSCIDWEQATWELFMDLQSAPVKGGVAVFGA